VGVDLSALTVVVGALGLGVSFGLQTITTNFVSGIIVLLERPIKVGDRIDVGSINGDVIKIALRATTVRTNDNIEIIIPNSEFINNKVINWSYSNKTIRFAVPIGTAYDSDPKQVRALLLEAARAHQGVLETPPPEVIFIGFGDSSLNFELRVWTEIYCTTPLTLKSDLYFEIFDKFKEANIEVPFPQRDIHIRSAVDFVARQAPNNEVNGSSSTGVAAGGSSAGASVSAASEHASENS
jgi:small-conductance mechanosensitive channel